MLGVLFDAANKWLKKYRKIAKSSPFYIFGTSTTDMTVDEHSGNVYLAAGAAGEKAPVFQYRNLTINEGYTLTIDNKPMSYEGSVLQPSLSPLILVCSGTLTVNGHLNVDCASSYIPAEGFLTDTSMYLGQKFIAGTKYPNDLFDSVSESTFHLIKAYATNNIMNNLEVIHAGKGSFITGADQVYPAKGGMVVLYYNHLNNNGIIRANGGDLPAGDPQSLQQTYGGGTLIICARNIVVGSRGKITADAGREAAGYAVGKGCSATLNTVPEQAPEDQYATASYLGYNNSVYACINNVDTVISFTPGHTSESRNLYVLNTLATYKLYPNESALGTSANNITLCLPSGTTAWAGYIVNMTSISCSLHKNTGSIFSNTIGTLAGREGAYVTYNNGNWSMNKERAYYDCNIDGISGESKTISFTLPKSASSSDKTQFIFASEMDLKSDSSVNFVASTGTHWSSKVVLLYNATARNGSPFIYFSVYKKDIDGVETLLGTSDMVAITTKSAEKQQYKLTVPFVTNITLNPGETFVYKYYLYYPARFYVSSSNSSIHFYVGSVETAASEAIPSTVNCPPCDRTVRGGAGLCIGIKLPEVV